MSKIIHPQPLTASHDQNAAAHDARGAEPASHTWLKDENTGGWKCEMPGNITLFAVPDHLARHSLKPKPSRGTKWRAGCTHWDEATKTASRFGRDAYMDLQPDANTAKSLAGLIYRDEIEKRRSALDAQM